MEGKRAMNEDMKIVEVLLKTGWTFEHYREQPQWVIDHIECRHIAHERFAKFQKNYG